MKKKQILIVIGCILVVALGIIIALCLLNKNNTIFEVTKVKKLLEKSSVIEGGVSKDKRVEIKLNSENIDNTLQVEIWIFSNPFYLGKFNLTKKDNGYYELDDISNVLKNKNIETGNHKLLILKNKEALGYVDIKIDSGSILETTLEDLEGNKTTSKETSNDEALTDKETNSSDSKNNQVNDKQNNNQNSNTNTTNKDNNNNASKKEDTSTTVKKEEPVEEQKQEEGKCTPKKFKNKYTYVFEDEETCVKNGDQMDAWEYFQANGISAYTYGCEEIIDECGNKYYGVYFGNMDGEKYYY